MTCPRRASTGPPKLTPIPAGVRPSSNCRASSSIVSMSYWAFLLGGVRTRLSAVHSRSPIFAIAAESFVPPKSKASKIGSGIVTQFQHFAHRMRERQVHVFDLAHDLRGDVDLDFDPIFELTAFKPGKPDGHQPLLVSRLHGPQDIRRVAAAAKPDRNITPLCQRDEWLGKDVL